MAEAPEITLEDSVKRVTDWIGYDDDHIRIAGTTGPYVGDIRALLAAAHRSRQQEGAK